MDDDGIDCGRYPGDGWIRVGHGVHVRADRADDLVHRLRAWQLALPFWTSFTALTAAEVRGWWLPPLPPQLPLYVASCSTDRIDRPGLRVCRHDVLPPWQLVRGVHVPSAAETVLSCARELGLLDVVLIGDAALHTGDVTRRELREAAGLRRRGAPLLRRAIPLMDPRAESIYESLMRVLHKVCGIEVEPQYDVLDAEGAFVGRGDLLLVGARTLHEMDGGHHRTAEQHQRDLRRDRRLLAAGYERRGYTARDVLVRGVGIVRDAESTLGRDHDSSRIQQWYSLLAESLFTASGQRRLASRVGLTPENAEGLGP